MSTEVISRPPRRAAPPLPTGELALEPPPVIPQHTGARWQQWLSVLPMLAGTMATALMFGGRDGASPYAYVIGAIFGLSTLGMLITNWSGSGAPRKAELIAARRDYLRYLAGQRRRVRAIINEQRESLAYRHPEPQALWALAMGPRVWERRPTDGDFGVVRVGVGTQSLATPLIAPMIDPTADLEPVTAGALRRFLDTYSLVPDLPISVALRAFARMTIVGSDPQGERARGLARALVGSLATFHAPDDLLIVALVAPPQRREWEWLKWLPHAHHPTLTDAAGPRRLVTSDVSELDELLEPLVGRRPRFQPWVADRGRAPEPSAAPAVVVIVDGLDCRASAHLGVEAGLAGVTVIEVGEPPAFGYGVEVAGAHHRPPAARLDRTSIRLTIDAAGSLHSATLDEQAHIGTADSLTLADAEALARQLAPLRLSAAVREQAPLAADRDLAELLGIPDVATADLGSLWVPRPAREVFRIPIGTGPDGAPVELDLKEAAQDGMGPHGLIVGATGSGKSELLRTLVLGLALTHSSEELNFVLVDFKGGATFASLDALPHTSAVITNLADALPLVDRMKDAMSGELTRRQELLRQAGNVASLRDYNRVRSQRNLPPLPSLLLVCDEFTEMLTAKPDFIDLFVQIGRIGRSIGVHLLLATQRLEEGRLRGLESNLSYRIALRTFTAHESRMTLGGASDAAELPSSPGHGYLRVGTDALQRFKAAYSSGPYRPRSAGSDSDAPRAVGIVEFTTAYEPEPVTPEEVQPEDPLAPSLMDVIIRRLAGQGPPAHRVWLPPLSDPPNLDDLLGLLATVDGRGLTTADPALHGALRVPVAVVDKPFEQRRDIAWFDLSGPAGHVAIVGGPQSGKSTAVRTLATALALTHTPQEVQIYCLDFGGGSLGLLRDLPHVGGVAGRLDSAAVRRTVGELSTLLADRERRFARYGIDSIVKFRQLRRPSDLDATVVVPEDGFGDVFLVIDGWSTLRNEFEDLEAVVVDLATRGLSYGIHLVVTATRWFDLRQNVRDLLGSRLELRLGDPADSAINRRSAANVPATAPGRGLDAEGLHVLTALPQVADRPPAALAKAVAAEWSGRPAPPVRLLPPLLQYSALLAPTEAGEQVPVGSGLALPIGIAEADLRPVLIDFASDPHLVAFGDSECGKSTLLRVIGESITRRFAPEQARIVLVDYRRSLLGAVTTEHLIGYGTAAENTAALIQSVAAYMEKRLPGPDVTPEQLRDRSWWSGPECFVLVDDYDLVTTGTSNPLLPLLPYLSQARDVGLHLVLTRRAGGAGRALYEPILQRLRELGSPGIVMAGDRDEGPLVGSVRPGPQPPGRGWLVTRKEGTRLVQLAHL